LAPPPHSSSPPWEAVELAHSDAAPMCVGGEGEDVNESGGGCERDVCERHVWE